MLSSIQHGYFYIATEINIHVMQASFYIIVCNGFSLNFSIRDSSA